MDKVKGRKRIAWVATLDDGQEMGSVSKTPRPAKGGESTSSYATANLLPLLKNGFEIELFSDFEGEFQGWPVKHYLNGFRIDKVAPFDLWFYQLEDTPRSQFVRIALGLKPGVVWFHDLLMSNDGPEPILNSPWRDTVSKFAGSLSYWPERGKEYQQSGPIAYRESAYALKALFSNPQNHDQYMHDISITLAEKKVPSAFVPLPVLESPLIPGPGRGVIGLFGSPQPHHRVHKILEALNGLSGSYKSLIWLVDESDRRAAQNLLDEFGSTGVELRSPNTIKGWEKLLPDIDIALHLHFSAYRSPGPMLLLSLMAGKLTIVTDFASSSYLPDEAVFKIIPGAGEGMELRYVLAELLSRIPLVSVAAQHFAVEFHHVRSVADELTFELNQACALLKPFCDKWLVLEQDARESLMSEAFSGVLQEDLPGTDRMVQDLAFGAAIKELGWG